MDSRRAPVAALAAATGLLLAGCTPGQHAGSSAAATSASATAQVAGCPGADMSLGAVSTADRGRDVLLRGTLMRFVCGGPDNGHYESGQGTRTVTLTPSTTLELLVDGGPQLESVALTDLRARLAAEPVPGVFEVEGPDSGVTHLTEVYRP